MKNKKIIFLVVLIVIVNYFDRRPNEQLLSTLFTVIGIFFSIGYSLCTTFDDSKITNKDFLKILRANFKVIQINFIIFFVLAAVFLVLPGYFTKTYQLWIINFSLDKTALAIFLYTTFYFIYNFQALQKLKNDVSDKIKAMEEIKRIQ